jgi:hypothetical protein
MYQNIVLSPLTLRRLEELSPATRYQLLPCLISERLLSDCDASILKEYGMVVDEATTLRAKYWLHAMLPDLIERVQRIPEVKAEVRDTAMWGRLDTELRLAYHDKWKIILADGGETCDLRNKEIDSSIEIIDAEQYLHPTPKSRVRAVEVINLAKGDVFDFRGWISKYLRGAGWIKVIDGYMLEDDALEDIIHIIRQLPAAVPITLATLTLFARKKEAPPNYTVADRQRLLCERTARNDISWVLHNSKSECRDRVLETDKFTILLGHALGWINHRTKTVKSQATLSVTPHREMVSRM